MTTPIRPTSDLQEIESCPFRVADLAYYLGMLPVGVLGVWGVSVRFGAWVIARYTYMWLIYPLALVASVSVAVLALHSGWVNDFVAVFHKARRGELLDRARRARLGE